jgi:hypothetical protein
MPARVFPNSSKRSHSYAKRIGRPDLSLLAADRAVLAAQAAAEDVVRIAAAKWSRGHILLALGDADGPRKWRSTRSRTWSVRTSTATLTLSRRLACLDLFHAVTGWASVVEADTRNMHMTALS